MISVQVRFWPRTTLSDNFQGAENGYKYTVLGVSSNATNAEINEAHRKIRIKQNTEELETRKIINNAKKILCDEDKRA